MSFVPPSFPRPRRVPLPLALLAGGLLLRSVGCGLAERLPSPDGLPVDDERIVAGPRQEAIEAPPFEVEKGGITFKIEPKADYELTGLVVSTHRSDSFADYYHEVWQDRINVGDICVVWGANLAGGVYEKLDFWSEPFTCNFRTYDEAAWKAFRLDEVSNNHLLAVDGPLRRKILSARPGDVVTFRGKLSLYSNDRGFSRGTSFVREDTGNGACETVWVESFEIAREANRGGRALESLGGWAMVAGFLLGMVALFRRPKRPAASQLARRGPAPPRPRPTLPDVWEPPTGAATAATPSATSEPAATSDGPAVPPSASPPSRPPRPRPTRPLPPRPGSS